MEIPDGTRISPRLAKQTSRCRRGGGIVKILIRATNWVGDAIMGFPALRAVRGKFPTPTSPSWPAPTFADIYRANKSATNSSRTISRANTRVCLAAPS